MQSIGYIRKVSVMVDQSRSHEEWQVFIARDHMLMALTDPQGYYGPIVQALQEAQASGAPQGANLVQAALLQEAEAGLIASLESLIAYLERIPENYKNLLVRHVNLAAEAHPDDVEAFHAELSAAHDHYISGISDFMGAFYDGLPPELSAAINTLRSASGEAPIEGQGMKDLVVGSYSEYDGRIQYGGSGDSEVIIGYEPFFDPDDDIYKVVTLDYELSSQEVASMLLYLIESLEEGGVAQEVIGAALDSLADRYDLQRAYLEPKALQSMLSPAYNGPDIIPDIVVLTLQQWLDFASEYDSPLVNKAAIEGAAFHVLGGPEKFEDGARSAVAALDGENQYLSPLDTPQAGNVGARNGGIFH